VNELTGLIKSKVKPIIKDDSKELSDSEEKMDANILQSTIETISEILQRDDCEKLFESLYPIILKLRQNIRFTFSINPNDFKTYFPYEKSSSFLTPFNVNLNSIWETICYQIEKLITNDMIKNNLDNEYVCEKICSQLRFLLELKDNEGVVIWRLYNTMRVCKLEREMSDWNPREFNKSMKHIITMIRFDCKLYKSGYFGSYNISYNELVIPYMQSVKTKFETEVSSLNGDVSNLINLLKSMIEFDNDLEEIRQDFPRFMESPEQYEMFDWKTLVEKNGCINLLHRTIYNKINDNLRELNCFNNNSYNECTANEENILCCVSQIFHNFQNYEHLIALDSFNTFLSYAISANIVDFFVHHFNNGKYDTISQQYTLLNTIHYMKEKLEKMNVNINKFVDISNKLKKLIIAIHLSIMLMNSNTQYWLLCLKKLWFELELKLKFFRDRESIFIFILSETVHNFSRIAISKADAFFILNNIDELMFKYAKSRKELLNNDEYNIHSSCWLIFIKLVLQITTNENFLANLKQNNFLLSENFSNTHWIEYIKPELTNSTFWFNAKLCIEKENVVNPNAIIRALLSNNCGLSSYILLDIEDNQNKSSVRNAADIFQIVILQNFKPKSLSIILLPLIERYSTFGKFFSLKNLI
jgi:hypothetical protein